MASAPPSPPRARRLDRPILRQSQRGAAPPEHSASNTSPRLRRRFRRWAPCPRRLPVGTSGKRVAAGVVAKIGLPAPAAPRAEGRGDLVKTARERPRERTRAPTPVRTRLRPGFAAEFAPLADGPLGVDEEPGQAAEIGVTFPMERPCYPGRRLSTLKKGASRFPQAGSSFSANQYPAGGALFGFRPVSILMLKPELSRSREQRARRTRRRISRRKEPPHETPTYCRPVRWTANSSMSSPTMSQFPRRNASGPVSEQQFAVGPPDDMDSGRTEVFTGYRVQHHPHGPAKGGTRFGATSTRARSGAQRSG